LRTRESLGYLEDYQRGVGDALSLYWGVDQRDSLRLRSIVASDFNGGIDLIIDDASHLYDPTRASFEALFPYLRPGGMYIIEDWAWAHWHDPNTPAPNAAFNEASAAVPDDWLCDEVPLSRLVLELIAMLGSTWLVASLTVRPGFIALERGTGALLESDRFNIRDHIVYRAIQPIWDHAAAAAVRSETAA
jgi:hypothetical protein